MEQQIEEMQALINVLQQQLHAAIDAACTGAARATVAEARLAKALAPKE